MHRFGEYKKTISESVCKEKRIQTTINIRKAKQNENITKRRISSRTFSTECNNYEKISTKILSGGMLTSNDIDNLYTIYENGSYNSHQILLLLLKCTNTFDDIYNDILCLIGNIILATNRHIPDDDVNIGNYLLGIISNVLSRRKELCRDYDQHDIVCTVIWLLRILIKTKQCSSNGDLVKYYRDVITVFCDDDNDALWWNEIYENLSWGLVHLVSNISENRAAIISDLVHGDLIHNFLSKTLVRTVMLPEYSRNDDVVLIAVLRGMSSIISEPNPKYTDIFISHGCLQHFNMILYGYFIANDYSKYQCTSTMNKIIQNVLFIISNITAGTQSQIQSVIDANLIPIISAAGRSSNTVEALNKDIIFTLCNATVNANDAQMRYLVHEGLIEALYSPYIRATHHDIQLIFVVLDAVENILLHHHNGGGVYMDYKSILRDLDFVTWLEELLQHKNEDIYLKASLLLDNIESSS